jgi:hypothetical protein
LSQYTQCRVSHYIAIATSSFFWGTLAHILANRIWRLRIAMLFHSSFPHFCIINHWSLTVRKTCLGESCPACPNLHDECPRSATTAQTSSESVYMCGNKVISLGSFRKGGKICKIRTDLRNTLP